MVANYSKPITLPIWADTGLIVVPSPTKQSEGWLNTEKPPASFFNWYQQLNGSWMRWFDERLDDNPIKWQPLTAYIIGDQRANVGNTYIVTVAGTSAASGGPTGVGTGIIDGTVTWDYVAAVNGNVFVIKNPNDRTAQLRTITTGGIGIDTGLNVGFSGPIVAGKIQVTAAGGTIAGSATGITIEPGLNVGFVGTPGADTIACGDSNFLMDGSLIPSNIVRILFDGSSNRLTFTRTTPQFSFAVSNSPRLLIGALGVSLGVGVAAPDRPLTIEQFTPLGNTAGDFSLLTRERYNATVDVYLDSYAIRTVTGVSSSQTSRYLQRIDGTYQGFVSFYGASALAPLGSWSGITTTGVGIGSDASTGPPLISSPTVFVDATTFYVGSKKFQSKVVAATAPPWTANNAYVIGNTVNSQGGIYIATNNGTSSISNFAGPFGRTTGFVDGTVTWDFVSDFGPVINLQTFFVPRDIILKVGETNVVSQSFFSVSVFNREVLRIGTEQLKIMSNGFSEPEYALSSISQIPGPLAGDPNVFSVAKLIVSAGRLEFGNKSFYSYLDPVLPTEMGNGSTGLALFDNAASAHKSLMARVINTSGVIITTQTCLALGTGSYSATYLSVRMFPSSAGNHRFVGVAQAEIAVGATGWANVAGTCLVIANNAQAISSNSYLQYQSSTIGRANHLSPSSASSQVLGVPLVTTAVGVAVKCHMIPMIG